MIDAEKTIDILTHCIDDKHGCYGCPNRYTNGMVACKEFWDGYNTIPKSVVRDAIALLKEQETVEPIAIKQEMFDEFYGAVSHCPKCDCMWVMYRENDMHYCPECGQAGNLDQITYGTTTMVSWSGVRNANGIRLIVHGVTTYSHRKSRHFSVRMEQECMNGLE